VSSVATAPGGASSRPGETARPTLAERRRPGGDVVIGAVGAAALCLVAFFASGGVDLAPNTWVQVGLIVVAAGAAIALAVFGDRGPTWGGTALLLFAALAALTYASIAWSVQPDNSWLEANRTLSYFAAFAAALMLARLAPERWPALVGAVAAAATVICGYALLVKVFPATFDATDSLGRLQAPFGYWNAVGLMGALGIPVSLWAGARREGSLLLRTATVPALAILVSALTLTYSRSAIVVAVMGLVVWFALAPLRLRSALILALGLAGAAAISIWGLTTRGISADSMALPARTSAGHTFGIVLVIVLVIATGAGAAAVLLLDRTTLPVRARRSVATGLLVLVALLPIAGIGALAASQRGLTGEVSHFWNGVTNPNGIVSDTPGRLVDLSNSRPHYWSLAITLGEHHLLAGVGAVGFATAQPSSSSPVWNSEHAHATHAHGYLAETFADFGLIGLAVSLALLVAWWLAAARTLELRWPRRASGERVPPGGEAIAERTGLIALLAVVVTFGVHSLIDWTWFIPGCTVPALACAGWLAGRGPLSVRVGRLPHPRRLSRSPGTVLALMSTVVVTLVAIWVVVQPLRSADAASAAETAAYEGNGAVALSDARSAAAEDPVSVEPLFLLAVIYDQMGNRASARSELVQATSRQPANAATWQELGCFDYSHHDPAVTQDFRRLLKLQPADTQAQSDPVGFCTGVTT
jgi:O-Antigen ligase